METINILLTFIATSCAVITTYFTVRNAKPSYFEKHVISEGYNKFVIGVRLVSSIILIAIAFWFSLRLTILKPRVIAGNDSEKAAKLAVTQMGHSLELLYIAEKNCSDSPDPFSCANEILQNRKKRLYIFDWFKVTIYCLISYLSYPFKKPQLRNISFKRIKNR